MSFVRTFSAVSLFCQVSEVDIQKDSQTAGEMNLFQILIIAAAQQALCKQAFDLGTGDRKLLGQKFISSDFQVMRTGRNLVTTSCSAWGWRTTSTSSPEMWASTRNSICE